ncbi:Cytochrome c oxidase subunit 4 [Aphelenchoides bicaudatus]|nr:Cytochrome c oxidase subunit 4 [Aphelenchoides bicaudatus]
MSMPKSLALPRLARSIVVTRAIQTSAPRLSGLEYWWGPEKAAGREQVGHGISGDPSYTDRLDYWYPAIRYRKEDDVIKPIRTKEQGDWKNLSIDEKKLLYRYSFRQTLAEFEAPDGYWKVIVALSLFVASCATLYATFLNHFVYPPLPPTFQNEFKASLSMLGASLLMNSAFRRLKSNESWFSAKANSLVRRSTTTMKTTSGNKPFAEAFRVISRLVMYLVILRL